MKINRLYMENFRNHAKTDIPLDRINIFAGGNNAGKTSILAAVEWCLTGRCLWTDRAGRGAADLVRQGDLFGLVGLDLAGLGGVLRSTPEQFLTAGSISGVNAAQAAIFNHLGTDEGRLRVSLNAGAFMTMSPVEQRALLFAAYGLDWTAGEVTAELGNWLTKQYPAEDAARLAGKTKSYCHASFARGPEVFDIMEKRAKDQRKALKKDKQRLEAAWAELAEIPGQAQAAAELEEAKSRLNNLKSERDRLLLNCGASQDAQQRRADLLAKIRENEEKSSQAEEMARSLEAELTQLGGPFGDLAGEEKAAHEAIDTLVAREAALKSRQAAVVKAAKELSNTEKRCPLAPDLLPCGLAPEQIAAALDELNKEQAAISRDLESIAREAAGARETLSGVKMRQAANREKDGRVMELKTRLTAQQALVESLERANASFKEELAALPGPDAWDRVKEELAEIDRQVSEGEAGLARLGENLSLAGKKAALQEDYETVTSELGDLEALARALGPDGLRRDMLDGVLKGFTDRVNDRLGRLSKSACQISFSRDMDIFCRVRGGPLLPLKLLSKSEQFRVGIAVSEALSWACGLEFLAIDEADILDAENRQLLSGMLLELAGEYEQVLVFSTTVDIPPQKGGLAGVKVFWVEEGAVREL